MTKITLDFNQTKGKRTIKGLLSLFVLLLMGTQMSWGQQVIGSFPTMDGGFEGQAASGTPLIGTAIATGTQRSDWTCGTSSYGTVQSASPRTGLKYINFNLTANTKRIQSPTAADGAIIGSTSYIVQYYYRTGTTAPGGGVQTIGGSSDGTNPTTAISYTIIGAVGSTTSGSNILTGVIFNAPIIVGASITGTGIPASSTILSFTSNTITISNNATATASNIALTIPLAATNGTWTKISAKVTAAPSTPTTKYGYFAAFRTASAMSSAMEIDDFVAYAGTVVDETAPDAPTALAFGTTTATQMPISWTAPGTGIDGGGYLVVRYTSDPTGQPDPNVNGIYAIGSTIGTGVVSYLGISPGFTDLGLTPSTSYFYRVYTVDKAFNYSPTFISGSNSTTAPSYAAEPIVQASGVSFSSISSTGFTVNFTAGDGTNNLVIIKTGSVVNSDPSDGNTYSANTALGSGSQLGSGNYVVYNGTGNSVSVTGLSKATTYYVKVYSYNGSAGSENYLITSPATGNQLALPGEIVSTGTNSTGVTWATTSAWVGGVLPGANDNVTIVAGDKIQLAAAASCYNLTIQPTGKLYNNVNVVGGSMSYLTINGTSATINGTLGDKDDTAAFDCALGLYFNGNMTITGSGIIRPGRLRPNTNTQNATLTIDADMEMTYKGSSGTGGASIYTDSSSNDNITITVNSGKTLSFVGLSNLNTASSSSTNGTASTTINVNGTLTLPTGSNLSMPIVSGKTCVLNVNGTLNVDKLNATSSSGGSAPTITVGPSGVINVSNTADFSSATLSATVTGSGTFNLLSGAVINIGATTGLEPVAGPIRTATRNFSTGANYSFTGSSTQATGADLPSTVNNLTINNAAGVTLSNPTAITNKLTLTAGEFNTGNQLTLKSDATKTAIVAPVVGSITGNVIVERFIPAGNRAYRLLSPATTGGTIQANWQEGGLGDPLPGFGTHITGTGGAANGFDATTSNAASLFTHNNTTPAWIAATNTSGTLTAGSPYLIYLRGSRQADNINGNLGNDATTLRTTGTLATGIQTVSGLNTTPDGFSLIGNPYQAQVDIQAVLSASTDLVQGFYYVLDPAIGTKGTYVTIDVTAVATADYSKFLQPGQACFVKTASTTTTGPALSFLEANKSEASPQTSIFKTKNTAASLDLTLLDGTSKRLDILKVDFDASETNAVNENDATKLTNFDENMATSNSSQLLSIEKRAIAVESDEIPLNITKYRGTSYKIKAQGTGLTGPTPYLVDAFANTITEIPQNGNVEYAYTVDTATPASIAADRFKITYTNKTLKTIDNAVKSFSLYPNPSKTNSFSVVVPQGMKNASITVSNMLGQKVYSQNGLQEGATARVNVSNVKTAGVYLVSLTSEGRTATTKWIVE